MSAGVRIVFMGTRDIALPVLQALLDAGRPGWQVVGVVTQPDRALGRSLVPQPPPVKLLAQARGVPVFQPETLRSEAAVALLRDLAPNVGVVASYALLLPRRVLTTPPAGWLNVHPSLLPRHRGPAPVVATLLAGDREAGVTLIKLVRAMDAGPIVDQVRVRVQPDDTTASLTERLGQLGAERLVAVLGEWVAGLRPARPQDDAAATYSSLLTRADGLRDWHRPAVELERRIRALWPWPGTFTFWEERRLVILAGRAEAAEALALPGTVLGFVAEAPPALRVACGEGVLAVARLQLEGRRALSAEEFARGLPAIRSARLGGVPKGG